MKPRHVICPVIAAPCIVAMPVPFPIKMIVAAILGYMIEWMFDFLDSTKGGE